MKLLRIATKSGTVYDLAQRASGFYSTTYRGESILMAVVGPERESLCMDTLTRGRKITKSLSPSGDKALGFEGSKATLEAREPKLGWKLFGFTQKGRALRLSTTIVSITPSDLSDGVVEARHDTLGSALARQVMGIHQKRRQPWNT
jgi:hypothetical protein